MEVLVLIPLFLVALIAGWAVATHNAFVRLEKLMRESWANVDVALKRRHDLIPNLVETVKAFAAHEREVFERVIAARERALTGGAAEENDLARATNALLARAEAYPELRSSANFLELQRELVNTEDRIAAARRFFNANVRDYNTMREQFPSSIMAGGRSAAEFYEVESISVREPVEVNLS